MDVDAACAGGTGAAKRRRERRLRMHWRHEQLSLRMALAEACHHSSSTFPLALKERRVAGQVSLGQGRGTRALRRL